MFIKFLTQIARRLLVGSEQEFVFKKVSIEEFNIPSVKKIGMYIHIPFCKNICPFCPYNKIKYDKTLTNPYLDAVLKEIELYHERLGRVEISSIYIGGGTPTNLIDEVGIMIKMIKEKFLFIGK